jgi:membrane associated rhomboid family serine protease
MPRIHITPVVLNLIIINALVFVALNLAPKISPYFALEKSNIFGIHEEYTQTELDGRTHTFYIVHEDGVEKMGPDVGGFKPIQLVTSFFSHFQIWHIFLNMLVLFQFGPPLETIMGARRFLTAYLLIGLGQTVLSAFLDPSPIPVVGASGALFGIMVLFAYYYPQTKLGMMFIPIYLPVRKLLIGIAALSAVLIVVEVVTHRSMGHISHFGHLAGMAVGFAYLHAGRLRKLGKK